MWDAAASLPVALTATSTTGATKYLYGGALLAQQDASELSYLEGDALASTRTVSDVSGAATASVSYDVFGAPSGGTPSAFLLGSQQHDAESGLYYLRARTYDPTTGRFLQADTWGGSMSDTQSLNAYTYCENGPVDVVDPSGRFGWSTITSWVSSAVSTVRQVGSNATLGASCIANEVKSNGFYGAVKNIWAAATSAGRSDASSTSSSACESRDMWDVFYGDQASRATSGTYQRSPPSHVGTVSQMAANKVTGAVASHYAPLAMAGVSVLKTGISVYSDATSAANRITSSTNSFYSNFSDPNFVNNPGFSSSVSSYYSGTYGSVLDFIGGHMFDGW